MTSAELEPLGQRAARELRERWRRGEPVRAEAVLERYPELRDQPDKALDVIYEEYLQRTADGDPHAEEDLLRRFAPWEQALRMLLECDRLLRPVDSRSDYPAVGDRLGEFSLLSELGQGAYGRVFVASQSGLADRLVVLKLTPLEGVEHLSLARLQHTNIVPVYSVVDDAEHRLRMLVMPYFGRTTLATLLNWLADIPLAARRGEHLVAALDAAHDPQLPVPATAPIRQMLAHVSYTQAVCWIGACLADGLQYAHDRGLIHLDVKPSNVLLATDGQPMLLDFHLARAAIPCEQTVVGRLGGTLEYMAPEQREAMLALQESRPIGTAVDARADVFALGALLYELLASVPLGDPRVQPLNRTNPQVSRGLCDLVAKCQSPAPAQRYASASQLAEDLRRHLADQPLAHVANRSLAERWHKWRRRQPHTIRLAGLSGVVVAAISIAAGSAALQFRHRTAEAEQALREGRQALEHGRPRDALQSLERGLRLTSFTPLRPELADQLRAQRDVARRSCLRAELHELANRTRVLWNQDFAPAGPRESLASLADLCGSIWNQRAQFAAQLTPAEVAPARGEVAADLLDVAIFWARLQRHLATDAESGRELALRTLSEAEAQFGRSPVLEFDCAFHRREASTKQLVSAVCDNNEHGSTSAWEHYALGRALLQSGDFAEAAVQLDQARMLEPAGLWPNFYFGQCAHRLGRHDEAVNAFSVCLGASPRMAACFYNRGVSLAALGRDSEAQRDFQRATELDPSLVPPAHLPQVVNVGTSSTVEPSAPPAPK